MTRNVVSIARTANLKHAVEAMTKHCITGLPVVDDSNRPVGVLSEKDVVRTLRELVGLSYPRSLWDLILAPEGRGEARDLHARLLRTLETTRVQQAMSSPAFTIVPGATILVALSNMLERGVHRLVVVEDGKISGIITRRDILSGMVPG
jgi:CBS domain-containing protein